jgi:hypothetical protein
MLVHLQGRNNILGTYFYMHATLVLIADHHHSTILPDLDKIKQVSNQANRNQRRGHRYESKENGSVIGDVFPLYLPIRATK